VVGKSKKKRDKLFGMIEEDNKNIIKMYGHYLIEIVVCCVYVN